MRLERLEISGFKSFSDRAELAFDRGVTAIVGPNGCGKSNVADAITWVLGEQSAKSLRGDRMEDVIFSGSDARKPGGAAEVRLRLAGLSLPSNGNGTHDESMVASTSPPTTAVDAGACLAGPAGEGGASRAEAGGEGGFEEFARSFTRDVEVTRRLYRSGESEYLIDGEVCRLRDVHELLMDTGLGAKAYAIIEQGKIGMILSSRPADRRQLIEEAAGITKYKSRRRVGEFKLEAAQQNLTRIDDIVFEVEKQRGALKRQAAKARRYRRLREELRRWEKVLFARRYRELAHEIETARKRLADAREREAAAAARVSELEVDMGRVRIEQVEADARASHIREDAHARELDINRRQQQHEFGKQQIETLAVRANEIGQEIQELEARREPARRALETRRAASEEAAKARDEAAAVLVAANDDHARAQAQIEGLESDVEGIRGEVFASLNAATALRHAIDHAAAQHERVGEALAKLDVERDDLRRETEIVQSERLGASELLARTHEALEVVRISRVAREAELASTRGEQETRTRDVRAREQELAAAEARLASLEELAASRAEYGDAARMVLVQANGRIGQQGAVADYLEVDSRYERAVEACLGDLLQHVIVERHEQAEEGLSLVRAHDAGRCGFVVIDPGSNGYHPREVVRMPGTIPVSDVLRVVGPHASTIRKVLTEGYVAETFDQAVALSRQTSDPVATLDGDVLRGPHLVSGGAKAESRGILATRREIKELRERVAVDRDALARASADVAQLEVAIAQSTSAITALQAEQHREEKVIVGYEAQLAKTAEDASRLARKAEVITFERRRAEEERASLDARRAEAEMSFVRLQDEQRQAEERLAAAQRRLSDAREAVTERAARSAEALALHAGLMERSSALEAEVARLEESARELEERVAARQSELEQTGARRTALMISIADGERALDDDVRMLDSTRDDLRAADETAAASRSSVDALDVVIRGARQDLEAIRARAGEFDVARATAESDLTHLAQSCLDAVQATLDDVLVEVEEMEQAGQMAPDPVAIAAEDADPETDDDPASDESSDSSYVVSGFPPTPKAAARLAEARSAREGGSRTEDRFSRTPDETGPPPSMTAEEAIARLKEKVDRLGPVNMMAIEQFDELEARHVFLTTQRRDLVDSIAQTTEAIERIDETTTTRFNDAFNAIQQNFQITFSTLFGGGKAGLTLLDENDPLDSGIDIVASPPGKRLQSVQLLSGGEKALTAIALMFAIFRYKPSPFCLLDEIDAPLDDANVGRFVEMLTGMLDRTQFILITHNRRTMEIANRLYGVTMEEPGVSKLISVQLN